MTTVTITIQRPMGGRGPPQHSIRSMCLFFIFRGYFSIKFYFSISIDLAF